MLTKDLRESKVQNAETLKRKKENDSFCGPHQLVFSNLDIIILAPTTFNCCCSPRRPTSLARSLDIYYRSAENHKQTYILFVWTISARKKKNFFLSVANDI